MEVPERLDRASYETAANGVQALVTANPETSFTLAHYKWPESALEELPECVGVVTLD